MVERGVLDYASYPDFSSEDFEPSFELYTLGLPTTASRPAFLDQIICARRQLEITPTSATLFNPETHDVSIEILPNLDRDPDH